MDFTLIYFHYKLKSIPEALRRAQALCDQAMPDLASSSTENCRLALHQSSLKRAAWATRSRLLPVFTRISAARG